MVPGRAGWVLVGLWVVATFVNLLKPFHLDDTAHLLIAQNILNDPWHPLSGMLNWLDTAEPVFVTNQPHLFFYLLAGVIAIFGPSELVLHLFLSLFTAGAIWASYRLFRRFVPDQALFLTAALVLGPGFLINQNVMLDIPLMAMMVLAVMGLIRPEGGARSAGAGFAIFAAALLSKYSAIFLYPALLWAALGRPRAWVWALLPIVALVGWSLFNLFDFGAVHVLNRPANEGGLVPSPKLSFALLVNLGVFAAPVAASLMIATRRRWFWIAAWIAGAAAYYPAILLALDLEPAPLMWANAALFGAALVVGLAALQRCVVVFSGLWTARNFARWYGANMAEVTLILWFAGGAVFLATFPPFMASRHALLLAVPLSILALRNRPLALPMLPTVAILAPWALLGLFVVANDISFARFYRDQAASAARISQEIAAPGAKIFTRGHWGWQWYARAAGMEIYDTARSQLSAGDILVDPVGISAQALKEPQRFSEVASIVQPRSVFTVLDTHRFYASGAIADAVFATAKPRQIKILRAED